MALDPATFEEIEDINTLPKKILAELQKQTALLEKNAKGK